MLKPLLPTRLPLGGLENPLDSHAVCALYLPGAVGKMGGGVGGGAKGLLNCSATNSVNVLAHSQPCLPCYITTDPSSSTPPPNIDLLSN
jgi:hypothetical protein